MAWIKENSLNSITRIEFYHEQIKARDVKLKKKDEERIADLRKRFEFRVNRVKKFQHIRNFFIFLLAASIISTFVSFQFIHFIAQLVSVMGTTIAVFIITIMGRLIGLEFTSIHLNSSEIIAIYAKY